MIYSVASYFHGTLFLPFYQNFAELDIFKDEKFATITRASSCLYVQILP